MCIFIELTWGSCETRTFGLEGPEGGPGSLH